MKATKYISWVSGVMLFVIAISAFVLSFEAIKQLAIENDIRPQLAWLVPVIVDGGIIVFSVSVLRAGLLGESAVTGWFLIILFTAVSIAFNIAHSNHAVWGVGLAVIAPVTLFASFETFMGQVKSDAKRSSAMSSLESLKKSVEAFTKKRDDVLQQAEKVSTDFAHLLEETTQKREQMEADYQTREAELANKFQAMREQLEEQTAEAERQYSEQIAEAERQYGEQIATWEARIEELKSEHEKQELTDNQRLILAMVQNKEGTKQSDIVNALGLSRSAVSTNIRKLKKAGLVSKNGAGLKAR